MSNAAAGLLIGVIVGLEYRSVVLPQRAKLFLSAGFLGGLSTFSTFSLDTVHLFMAGRYLSASVNVLINLGLGLSGVAAGMFMVKLV